MDQLLDFKFFEEFNCKKRGMSDTNRKELCLQIMQNIPIVDVDKAKLYCKCIAHLQLTLESLLESEASKPTMQSIILALHNIMLRNDVNSLQFIIEALSTSFLTEALSTAYSKFKANVYVMDSIPTEMDCFIQRRLITINFYAMEEPPKTRTEPDDKVVMRLKYLINLTEQLLKHEDISLVDAAFLFDLKQVIINIFMIKNTKKITKWIPWLELEFYCIKFLRYYTADDVINLFSYGVFSKKKLLRYLKCFLGLLETEANRPKHNRIKKPPPGGNDREAQMKEIIASTPQFAELAIDYNFLRDFHSMHRIGEVIALAREANLKTHIGRIVIARAVQVLGEHTKSTKQTAKMSAKLERRLLGLLPPDLLQVVQIFRDDVSHSAAVRRILLLSDFDQLQHWLGLIGDAIRYIIYDYAHIGMIRLIKEIYTSEANYFEVCSLVDRNSAAIKQLVNDDIIENSHFRQYDIQIYSGSCFFLSHLAEMYRTNYKKFQLLLNYVRYPHPRESISYLLKRFHYNPSIFFKYSIPLDFNYEISKIKIFDYIVFIERIKDLKPSQPRFQDTIKELASVLCGCTYQQFLRNDELCAAVELLLMETFSQLEEQKLLTNAHQWLDAPTPVLAGKPLRNYLAHYNALVGILPIAPRAAIFQNAQLLIAQLEDGTSFGQARLICFEPSYNLCDLKERIDELRCYVTSAIELQPVPKYPLHNAVELGDVNLVQCALRLYSVNKANDLGASPLHVAAGIGRLNIVRLLLQHGADTNSYDWRNFTPLHAAVFGNHPLVVDLLLQREVHVDASRTKCGRTCLHLAAQFDIKLTKMLITRGAVVDYEMLFSVVGFNNKEIVRLIFTSGVTFDKVQLTTCLNEAVIRGSISTAEELLDRRVYTNLLVTDTPILITAVSCNTESDAFDLVSLLISSGADVNARCISKRTALHIAAACNYFSVVSLLLGNDADPSYADINNVLPYHMAQFNNNLEILKELFVKDIATVDWYKLIRNSLCINTVEIVDFLWRNAPNTIHIKAEFLYSGRIDICRYFLSRKEFFDLEECIKRCIFKKYHEIMEIILEEQLTRSQTKFIYTQEVQFKQYCMIAIFLNRLQVALVMLNYLDPECITKPVKVNKLTTTLMHWAVMLGNAQVVKSLLSVAGCSVRQRLDEFLDLAICSDQWFVVDFLWNKNPPKLPIDYLDKALSNGHALLAVKIITKYINKTDYNGLMLKAAVAGLLDVVKFLVSRGVDPRWEYQLEAVQAAVAGGHIHVVEFFLLSKTTKHLFSESNLNLLHFAAAFKQIAMAERLLTLGCDINALDNVGITCLHVAATCNDLETVLWLLQHGAIYNSKNKKGLTALDLTTSASIVELFQDMQRCFDAVKFSDTRMIKSCHKVALDAEHCDYGTALHFAAKLGHFNVAIELLRRGAQYDMRSYQGVLPEDVAHDHRIMNVFHNLRAQFTIQSDMFFEEYFNCLDLKSLSQELEAMLFATNSAGHTAFQEAICNNHPDVNGIIFKCYTSLRKHEFGANLGCRANLLEANPTESLIFANKWYLLHADLQNYEEARELLYLIIEICTETLPPTYKACKYLIARQIELAMLEVIMGNYDAVRDILYRVYLLAETIEEHLLILHIAHRFGLKAWEFNSFYQKVLDILLYDFRLGQKEIIYIFVWYLYPAYKGRTIAAIEKFFNANAIMNEVLFKTCTFDIFSFIKTKKGYKNIGYYFSFLARASCVSEKVREGNVLKAYILAEEYLERMKMTEDELAALGIDMNHLRKMALQVGFTNAQVERNLKHVLHDAAREGNMKMLLMILKFGADAYERDENNMRAIDYATLNEHEEMVHVLLRHALLRH